MHINHPTLSGKKWAFPDSKFYQNIGFKNPDNLLNRIGNTDKNFHNPGDFLGWMTQSARVELGLSNNTKIAVASSLIDAHAGGLGSIFAKNSDASSVTGSEIQVEKRLSLIAGTSACLMSVTQKPVEIENIWGPYYSSMVPEMFLIEAGQSISGKLLDHVLATENLTFQQVDADLKNLKNSGKYDSFLLDMRNLHTYPDFHGNRSPLANSNLKGGVIGLTLTTTSLQKYHSAMEALAFQILEIIDRQNQATQPVNQTKIEQVVMTGGMIHNSHFVLILQHVLRIFYIDLIVCPDSVLLGSAMLGRLAFEKSVGKSEVSAVELFQKMSPVAEKLPSPCLHVMSYFSQKYQTYLKFRDFMCQVFQ